MTSILLTLNSLFSSADKRLSSPDFNWSTFNLFLFFVRYIFNLYPTYVDFHIHVYSFFKCVFHKTPLGTSRESVKVFAGFNTRNLKLTGADSARDTDLGVYAQLLI